MHMLFINIIRGFDSIMCDTVYSRQAHLGLVKEISYTKCCLSCLPPIRIMISVTDSEAQLVHIFVNHSLIQFKIILDIRKAT